MKERPILNEEWESINLRQGRPFREKTEEERQMEYFNRGEAVDMDYLMDINPNLKYFFRELVEQGMASEVKVETDGIKRTLVQYNEDPDRGEPRVSEWDEREWTEKL